MKLEIQVHKQCAGVKPVNGIVALAFLNLKRQYRYKQKINKNLHKFAST